MTTAAQPIASGERTISAEPPMLLVCVPPMPSDALDTTLANIAEGFQGQSVIVATPDEWNGRPVPEGVKIDTYKPGAPPQNSWVPRAADYLNVWTVARERQSRAILLLGPEASTVSARTLRAMSDAVMAGRDLVLPRYPIGPHDALVNSAILYPVTRALFSLHPRFPLPVDAAFSPRMSERLAITAQRLTAANQNDALLWPTSEAALAALSVQEVPADKRILPHPEQESLNALLSMVAGSFFTDIEAKSSFWQRARLTGRGAATPFSQAPTPGVPDIAEIQPMIETFRNAYTNLRELWSLVLPPNSLLSLKKLSGAASDNFRMPDALWARTVYDFMLAYRLRTINRGHLLGAMMPLYLAWAASHLLLIGNDIQLANQHIEEVAAAFENDKPYFVSRWRWPDRFNP